VVWQWCVGRNAMYMFKVKKRVRMKMTCGGRGRVVKEKKVTRRRRTKDCDSWWAIVYITTTLYTCHVVKGSFSVQVVLPGSLSSNLAGGFCSPGLWNNMDNGFKHRSIQRLVISIWLLLQTTISKLLIVKNKHILQC
jgi:hypothetical protein